MVSDRFPVARDDPVGVSEGMSVRDRRVIAQATEAVTDARAWTYAHDESIARATARILGRQ